MSTLKLSSETISLRTKCARQLRSLTYQQIRHATLIRRPKRPYTFTQLVKLSDGSSFLQRTTSPEAVYTSTKDARNTIMWNPSSQRLLSIEEDEAGKLSRFRERFGRGWDAKTTKSDTKSVSTSANEEDSLLDLINTANSDSRQDKFQVAKKDNAAKAGKSKA